MIKQVPLLALLALSFARFGAAASCVGGTLAGYVALGSGGCTIDGSKFYDFKVLGGSAGATEIASNLVSLTPSGGIYDPTLALSVNLTANAPAILETMFTYYIAGSGYVGTSALLSGSSEKNDGDVTGIANYCLGGKFTDPDGVDGCATPNGALVTDNSFQNSDSAAFSKVYFINVTNDFTLDGGTGTGDFRGKASGGTFTNSFAAVPEPVSIALTGLGLMLAASYRRRVKRSNKEIE